MTTSSTTMAPASAATATLAGTPAATPTTPATPGADAGRYPTLAEIEATAAALAGRVLTTPVWHWQTGAVPASLGPGTALWLKLELWQRSGSFKLRGALANLLALDAAQRQRGVVAASAGNHAMAVAQAAQSLGVPATVAMPRGASPVRIAACRAAGATVQLHDSIHDAFAAAQALVDGEGRTMVHPFDGHLTACGTATVGLELLRQVAEAGSALDAVVVPVGGGGLIGGIAAAVKQLAPQCAVYGVEPEGADAMRRSFDAGAPARLDQVQTVADSLGAPYALPYSYALCRRFVDDIVRVDDDALCVALHHLASDMKLAVEPACAAATAALLGPLRQRLGGRRVGLILCGANQDMARYTELLQRGAALLAA